MVRGPPDVGPLMKVCYVHYVCKCIVIQLLICIIKVCNYERSYMSLKIRYDTIMMCCRMVNLWKIRPDVQVS